MPITITSRFKPLTYDEITKPLIEQTQAQHALEDAYMAAQDQAAQIMAQANEQTDPQSYTRLKNYANAIQQQADVLMQQGLNRNSRQSLLNLHRRYGQDIIPIQLAAERRNQLIEEQRKMMLNNPDLLTERDASTISLDDLVRNPQLNYGSVYNGAMITQRVAQAIKTIGDSLVDFEANGHLTPYQIKILEKHGFSATDIANAIAGGEDGTSKLLREARDRVLNSIDVYNKGNASIRERALGYANEGLYAGIGSVKYSHVADEDAQAALKWKYQKQQMDYSQKHQLELLEKEYEIKNKAAKEAAEAEAERVLQEQAKGVVANNIYSQQEEDDYTDARSLFLKYFDVDERGNYVLNEEGKKEYETPVFRAGVAGRVGAQTGPSYFKQVMDRLAEDKGDFVHANLTPKNIEQLFNDFIQTHKTYDATKYTEYEYPINASDLENVNNRIVGTGSYFYPADWDKESQSFKEGRAVPISEALGKDGKVTSVQFSPYGVTMKIVGADSGGNISTKRYKLPRGINDRVASNIDACMNGIKEVHKLYNRMKETGAERIETPNALKKQLKNAGVKEEHIPKELNKRMLQQVVEQLEVAGQYYVSQLFGSYKTEPVKYEFSFR